MKLLKHTAGVAGCFILGALLQTAFFGKAHAEAGRVLTAYLQDRIVLGQVTDETGESIPGVNVLVKGTAIGTSTDAQGRYSLSVPGDAVTLVFSFIGYTTKEESLNGRSAIDIALTPDVGKLEEVTVVAFGIQKKESIVSSITTVRPGELKVPSSNLTTALAGRLSGVIAYQRSGEPGRDNAEFFIRGATTFGYKKDPLILIDGMEYTTTELARLQPDDIESFSIMKDATANALYGARGANGVIQVTTKSGREGKPRLYVRIENTFSSPTKDVQLADPVTQMKLHNESVLTRGGLLLPYSQYKVENTEEGTNPIVFPTVDWQKELFKKQTINQRANMSLSGGGPIANYYVSASFNQDNGILKVDRRNNFNSNINLKTFNLRSNIGINVTKTTNLMIRFSGTFDDYIGPIDGGEGVYKKVMRTNRVLFPAYYPVDAEHEFTNHILFGNAEEGNYLNPYADMVKGYKESSRSVMFAQLEVKQDLSFILPGLTFNSMLNTNRRAFFDVTRQYNPFWYTVTPANYDKVNNTYRLQLINPDDGTDFLNYTPGRKELSSIFRGQAQLFWKQTYNDRHDVSAMTVLLAQGELTGNAETLQESLPSRNLGISGRATYGYADRYFFEFNFGYNGSERFHKSERFGFFPSAGVAWSISNEKFFDPLAAIFTKVRVRANYGLVGNDAIGSNDERFFYLSELNMFDGNYSASFGTDGGNSRPGISVDRYDNAAITWETAVNSTFGLEIGVLDKVDLIAEYFTEQRSNILMERASIPNTLGLQGDKPKANVGKAATRAVDLSLDYGDYFGKDLVVTFRANFTFARNKFVAYEEPAYDYPWLYRVGHPIKQAWGYIAERLFVDGDSRDGSGEVGSSPTQFGEYLGGDIKFRDVNRDGVINQLDQVPLGYPTTPEIIYGFGFSAKYKSFDVNAFFQGSARSSFWIDVEATSPFVPYRYRNTELPGYILENQVLKAYADDHWSEENRNLYALWPRLSPTLNTNNSQRSTWFMRDGTFLRLKQVEIGYTFPARILERLHTENLRIYATGTNLLTWSRFDLWDVEMAGNGLDYPIQKQYNIGVQVSF